MTVNNLTRNSNGPVNENERMADVRRGEDRKQNERKLSIKTKLHIPKKKEKNF